MRTRRGRYNVKFSSEKLKFHLLLLHVRHLFSMNVFNDPPPQIKFKALDEQRILTLREGSLSA